jgi:hypothetical protein
VVQRREETPSKILALGMTYDYGDGGELPMKNDSVDIKNDSVDIKN